LIISPLHAGHLPFVHQNLGIKIRNGNGSRGTYDRIFEKLKKMKLKPLVLLECIVNCISREVSPAMLSIVLKRL
jgi:hypothetical protein